MATVASPSPVIDCRRISVDAITGAIGERPT
jgi:hypothetical protein